MGHPLGLGDGAASWGPIGFDPDVVNAELYPRWNEADGAAGKSQHTSGIAHRKGRVEVRLELLPGPFQRVAGFVEQLVAIAAARNRVRHADGELLTADQPAELDRAGYRASRRMEEDGRPAAPQLRQQAAKARRRTGVDLALCDDPLVAAPPARIRVAMGHIEYDFAHRRHLDHARRRLGGFGRLGHDGRSTPNPGDEQGKSERKQAGNRHCGVVR